VGFLGFGRAKWKHKDAKVRQSAVHAMESHQENLLMRIALGDNDSGVRAAAATKITRIDALRSLLASKDPAVRQVARERLAGVAFKLVKERALKQCADLLEQIEEQGSLSELSLSAKDPAVRAAAFEKWCSMADPSQPLLATVAIQDADGTFAAKAIGRIDKRGVLKDIAKKAKREDIRRIAHDKAEAMDADAAKPSAEKQRRARAAMLEQICERGSQLACSTQMDRASAEFNDLRVRWQGAADQFAGLEPDNHMLLLEDRFKRSQEAFAARCQEADAQAERMALDLVRRGDLLKRLESAIPATPDFIQQLTGEWQAFGPSASVEQRELERRFLHLVTRASDPNATAEPESKPDDPALLKVVAEAESLAMADKWREAADQFKVLHKKLLTSGLPNGHALMRRFEAAYAAFKDNRRVNREQRDVAYAARLKDMNDLVRAAETLAAVKPELNALREHFDQIKQLQASWKRIGAVRPEHAAPLRECFRAACDQAFIPVKELHEAEDWGRFTSAARVEALIDRVNALQSIDDISHLAKMLRTLQAEWKTITNLPRDKSQELWRRFKEAGDLQYARCREFFAKQDELRIENMRKKEALLAELEGVVSQGSIGLPGSVADLQAKAKAEDRVKAIQAEWKSVGEVPREHDQAIWKRYKELGDRFYSAKNAQRAREQEENLDKKKALCATVEELAANAEAIGKGAVSGDINRWTQRVREFQMQWKDLGYVPMEHKEAIWDRFRSACDRIYALSRSHYGAMDQESAANLEKKKALLSEIEALATSEKPEQSQDDTKKLQRRWKDIGPVPRDDEAALEKRWQELVVKIQPASS
jgi:hypothetical protein